MNNPRRSYGILILFIIMIGFIVLGIVLPSVFPGTPIKITTFSLNPINVRVGRSSVITIKVKNVDLKTHEITFTFNAGPRVAVFAGAEKPLLKSGSAYTYTFTLKAEDLFEERVFTVLATLEEGTIRAEYPIEMDVYVDNERMKRNWAVKLIVKK